MKLILKIMITLVLTALPITSCDLTYSSSLDNNITEQQKRNILLGNPQWNIKDNLSEDEYLEITRDAYVLSYNHEKLIPNWVSWNIENKDLGYLKRPDPSPWETEDKFPASWRRIVASDFYSSSNDFNKGHMCPNMDRNGNTKNQNDTFILSNIVPQIYANNGGGWLDLEIHINDQVRKHGKEAYVVAGPWGIGGYSEKAGYIEKISKSGITVPAYTWKVALILPEGNDDIARIESDPESVEALAVLVPNSYIKAVEKESYECYICSIDFIEEITGYDFFNELDDTIEEELESRNRHLDQKAPAYAGANAPEKDTGNKEIISVVLPEITITKYYQSYKDEKFLAITNTGDKDKELSDYYLATKESSTKAYVKQLPAMTLTPGDTIYLVNGFLGSTLGKLENFPHINSLDDIRYANVIDQNSKEAKTLDINLYFKGLSTIEIVENIRKGKNGEDIWDTIDIISLNGTRPKLNKSLLRLYDIDSKSDMGWIELNHKNALHNKIMDGTAKWTNEGIYRQPSESTVGNFPNGNTRIKH